jgi:hypothetical protein
MDHSPHDVVTTTRIIFVVSFVILIQTIILVLSEELKHLNKKKNFEKDSGSSGITTQ